MLFSSVFFRFIFQLDFILSSLYFENQENLIREVEGNVN